MESLKFAMPPPAIVLRHPGEGDWTSVEQRFGLELPADYKEFIDTYGTGSIDNFLWVLSPFEQNKNLNLIFQAPIRLDAQRYEFGLFGHPNPLNKYPLYPDARGLFPWGITDNGDVLYWSCEGPPSAWKIIAIGSRDSEGPEFDLSTTQFLDRVLTKDLVVEIFPDDFPSDSPRFNASR